MFRWNAVSVANTPVHFCVLFSNFFSCIPAEQSCFWYHYILHTRAMPRLSYSGQYRPWVLWCVIVFEFMICRKVCESDRRWSCQYVRMVQGEAGASWCWDFAGFTCWPDIRSSKPEASVLLNANWSTGDGSLSRSFSCQSLWRPRGPLALDDMTGLPPWFRFFFS